VRILRFDESCTARLVEQVGLAWSEIDGGFGAIEMALLVHGMKRQMG
jgi:hypothetical protein